MLDKTCEESVAGSDVMEDKMQAIDALTFSLEVYALTLVVALVVGGIIVAIRKITASRVRPVRTATTQPLIREEVVNV